MRAPIRWESIKKRARSAERVAVDPSVSWDRAGVVYLSLEKNNGDMFQMHMSQQEAQHLVDELTLVINSYGKMSQLFGEKK